MLVLYAYAVVDFTKAIDINPENAITYNLRGFYYFKYYQGNALDNLLTKIEFHN